MHKDHTVERYHYSLHQSQMIVQSKQRIIEELQTEKRAVVNSLQEEEKRGNRLRTAILNNHKKYIASKRQMNERFISDLFELGEDKKLLEHQLEQRENVTMKVISNLINIVTPPPFYATAPDFSSKTCFMCIENLKADEYGYFYVCACSEQNIFHALCMERHISKAWTWTCPRCRQSMGNSICTTYDLAIWQAQTTKMEKIEQVETKSE